MSKACSFVPLYDVVSANCRHRLQRVDSVCISSSATYDVFIHAWYAVGIFVVRSAAATLPFA